GGGFRIPAILKQSGAKLVEVGTTNKVHLRDYEEALASQPIALLLWVHRSNFRIVGFHEEPDLPALARLARKYQVPLVADVGSGALLDTTRYGLPPEPTVQQVLAAGADLVAFSGDKLLGGPQAGLVVGRAALVQRLSRHPLMRALRVDKLTLAALEATLSHYLRGEAEREVPVWAMLAARVDDLRARAQAWQQATGLGQVLEAQSTVGGGSLPTATLPSAAWVLHGSRPHALARALRTQWPHPVVARVAQGKVWLDPRTVLPEQDAEVAAAVAASWNA
ncbi:MAG: L-seryl-tRNA(Sec) selenium transferase, partial [Chloroflexi bacterium]|nr:L-seryl-tRNA(Sec) selenium transferase [Chloroflexota bacterium]